jgi:SAM-dependent methyltransferase
MDVKDSPRPGPGLGQYSTDEAIRIRTETHQKYGVGGGEPMFSAITRAMSEVAPLPTAILDVGAGTGNWYRAIREELGPEPWYTGLDQSPGMVEALTRALNGDAHGTALVGDAEVLPFGDGSFPWVGMHMMLYHVPHIHLALAEGWRVLPSGGVLTAATNAATPYRELWALGNAVAGAFGLPGLNDPVSFNLTNGAAFFPVPPTLRTFAGGFRFPAAAPALRYMASGPLWDHLGDASRDPELRRRALDLLKEGIEAVIRRDGIFEVHSEMGFFLAVKP